MISSINSLISFLCSKRRQLFAKSGEQLDLHTKPLDSLQAESLEPRILYSAAPVDAPAPEAPSEAAPQAVTEAPAAAAAPAAPAPAPIAAPTSVQAPQPEAVPQSDGESDISAAQGVTLVDVDAASEQARTEIVFVSSEVTDYQSLADNVPVGHEVIILDGAKDGVNQIAEALAGRTGIDAIHLLTHGSTGSLDLGIATLNSSSMLGEYADELSLIRESLSADADFLIYGCDFSAGETGLAAANLLSNLLDADVAASTDHTGAQSKGGDWVLETVLGSVEANTVKAPAWDGLLAPGVIKVADDGGQDDQAQDPNDITAQSVDYTNRASGFITVSIQIDPTSATGASTSNLATVFDTNNDGNADYGFAVSVSAANAGDPFTLSEFSVVYGKGNSFPNKVSGSTTTIAHWESPTGWDGAAALTALPTVDTTALDPFDASNDTLITLTINLNDIVGHDSSIAFGDIKFINTTTQPSHSVTSAPKDLGIAALGPFLAVADSATTDQGTAVVIDVSDNDSPMLSPQTVELATGPSNGTVTIGANGLVTYTPTGTFTGDDSFTYLIYGLDGDAREATVNVTVNSTNEAPVADDSTIIVNEESTDTALGLTAPTDGDGDTLTITVTGLPSVGTVTLADGTAVTNGMELTADQLTGLQFDAPEDLLATTVTSFTYTVDDGVAPPVTGTTSITVNPINDAPVPADSTIIVEEGIVDEPLGTTVPFDIDGDDVTITVTGLPSVGSVTLADGTPVTNGMLLTGAQFIGLVFDAPATVASTTVTTFNYTADDGTAPAVPGFVSITVNPVSNTSPAPDSSAITVDEESTDTPLGLSAPLDVDGDILIITVTDLPGVGTVTLADGTPVTNGMTLTEAQLGGLLFDAPADLAATIVTSFIYTVDDGTAPAVAGSTLITVNPINDAPVADDSTITVDEESTDTPLGLTAPTDPDGPAATIIVTGLPSVGTVTLADGTEVTDGMSLTAAELAGLLFDAPADLTSTTVTSFTYTVDDGVAPPVTGTTSITVNPVNDAPDLGPDTFTVDEDGSVTIDVLDNDSDVDGGALTITHVGGLAITEGGPAVAVTNGTVALVGGELVFTPAPDFSGPASFNYTVSDGIDSSTAAVTGTVTEVPEALTISNVSADESGVLTFTVTLDNAVASSFTVDLSAISGTATAGTDFSGSQTLTFAGTPGETHTFTVTPDDDSLIEEDETFTVVMSNVTNSNVNITDTGLGTILDNDARPAGLGITTDVELVANGAGGFDLVIEDVQTNSPIGFDSDVPVADSSDELFIERVGDSYVIRDLGGLALGSPIVGAIRGGDSEIIVPVAMVTGDIIFRTGVDDDIVTVGDLGATITGGLFIDTEDPTNRFNDFDVIHYNSDTTMAAGSDSEFRAETINALPNSRLEAAGTGEVTWDAGRNIFMDAGSLVASDSGDISYEANLAGQFTDNFAAVHLDGAEITSTSGNIDVDGRAGATGSFNRGVFLEFDLDTATGSAIRAGGEVTIDGTGGGTGLYGTGVAIHTGTVESTGAGPIRITGTGGDGVLYNEGISIHRSSTIDAGSGDLFLDGTGGATGHMNRGINAAASTFSSSGGNITVDGTGGGTGVYSMGAQFTGSDFTTDGTGTITMRGTGAGGTMANMGLQIATGSNVSTVDGAILLEGTGNGSTQLNHGVLIAGISQVSASGVGTVTLNGTGGAGTTQNQGVEIVHSTVSVNDGKLTVTGTGLGSKTNNRGVNVADSSLISSGIADIEVLGTGSSAATASQNAGTFFYKTTVTASGTGNVTLTGTGGTGSSANQGLNLGHNTSVTLASGNLVMTGAGGGTGSSNIGVGINGLSSVTVGGSGAVTINGTGGNGAMLNNGVYIASLSSVQVADGNLTVTGTGRGSGSLNDGVKLSHSTLTATGSGNILISGTGSQTATGFFNTGINMMGGSVTTASGNLAMTGLSGTGTTMNQGIRITSAGMLKTTGGGSVSVAGTSHASTSGLLNHGVYMIGASLDCSGIVGFTGNGGGGTMMNHGVYMGSITVRGTTPTCVGVAGGGTLSKAEDGNFLH